MAAAAWLRRFVVSIGIGGASYAIMLGIMVLSIVYDRELEPVVTFAFDAGRSIIGAIELSGVRKPLGPGGGEPPARTGEHDARRAVDPGDHHRSNRHRHSVQLRSRRHAHRAPADCDCAQACQRLVVLAVGLISRLGASAPFAPRFGGVALLDRGTRAFDSARRRLPRCASFVRRGEAGDPRTF